MGWAGRVVEEFWNQGDLEKKHLGAVSMPMYDRDQMDLPKTQIGFIQFIVIGPYDPLGQFLHEMKGPIKQMKKNVEYWQESKNRGLIGLPKREEWPEHQSGEQSCSSDDK